MIKSGNNPRFENIIKNCKIVIFEVLNWIKNLFMNDNNNIEFNKMYVLSFDSKYKRFILKIMNFENEYKNEINKLMNDQNYRMDHGLVIDKTSDEMSQNPLFGIESC